MITVLAADANDLFDQIIFVVAVSSMNVVDKLLDDVAQVFLSYHAHQQVKGAEDPIPR